VVGRPRESLPFPVPVERLGVDQARAVLIARLHDIEVAADVECSPPRGFERALTANFSFAGHSLATGLYLVQDVLSGRSVTNL
jgi:hypothetical protein